MTLTEIADAVERAGLEIVSRNEHGWRVVGQTQEALVRFDNRPDPDPRDGDPPYVEPFFFLKGLTNDDVRQRNPLTIV
ncbi:MAG: hypothetical protein KDD70_18895, partial [Bdellovibrionales bacterium]|nr:hypothetical protein [Bdellovibrionales bacterium]